MEAMEDELDAQPPPQAGHTYTAAELLEVERVWHKMQQLEAQTAAYIGKLDEIIAVVVGLTNSARNLRQLICAGDGGVDAEMAELLPELERALAEAEAVWLSVWALRGSTASTTGGGGTGVELGQAVDALAAGLLSINIGLSK